MAPESRPFQRTLRIGPGRTDCLYESEVPEVIERRVRRLGFSPSAGLYRGYDADSSGGDAALTTSPRTYAMTMDVWKRQRDAEETFGSSSGDVDTPLTYALLGGQRPVLAVFEAALFRPSDPLPDGHVDTYSYQTISGEPAITGLVARFAIKFSS
jgi:hypothetical protein